MGVLMVQGVKGIGQLICTNPTNIDLPLIIDLRPPSVSSKSIP